MTRLLRILRPVLWGLLAMAGWIAANLAYGVVTAPQIAVDDLGAPAYMAAARRYAAEHQGNLVVLRIDDGRTSGRLAHSIGTSVDGDTLFQAASLSKWIAAWGVMRLVERGEIDIDAPVSRYLSRWRLPPGNFANDRVTVRSLLGHTAGLSDGLGYCGFAAGEAMQTLEQSLTRAADRCPFRDGQTRVGAEPGEWRYSGGGYTLLQLLIEEVSGQNFADHMAEHILLPLGMTRSTFAAGAGDRRGLAQFFDADGNIAPHNRYTAAAAASLYTTSADLALFAQAHWPGSGGEPVGRGVLSPQALAMMRSPHASVDGRGHWGLGLQLYSAKRGGGHIIGHDGGNVPAVNTSVRLDLARRDAIILLSTGGDWAASRLGAAWVQQRDDVIDAPKASINTFVLIGIAQRRQDWIFVGLLLIVAAMMAIWWRGRRRKAG